MDPIDILIVLVISVICLAFVAGGTTERALDAFGAGFLPYREAGWPRGVQEEDPKPWHISAMGDRSVPPDEREPPPGAGAEIFEIDLLIGADVTELESGHVEGGTAIRAQ
jgi:hypothetical protein